mgnify:CR=1 FL=1
MTMEKNKKIEELEMHIYGRVQGVLFRKTIKDFAEDNRIRGYAKNRADGSVIIVFQGARESLEKALDWVKSSPGFTKVVDLDFSWSQPDEIFKNFEIVKSKNIFLDKGEALFNLGKRMVGISEERIGVPRHIAIIPDGNRRWARKKGLDERSGHYKSGSSRHVFELFKEARELGIKYVSLWGFSTENWGRDNTEKKAIFQLVFDELEKFEKLAKDNKIRFRHIGRKDRMPKKIILGLEKLEEKTKDNLEFNVILCLDYGGRDEIIRAINKALKSGVKTVSEDEFRKYLDTNNIPDPDLVIRTSGEKRISGFMPFQAAYAELYFSDKYFPEFEAEDLREAVFYKVLKELEGI